MRMHILMHKEPLNTCMAQTKASNAMSDYTSIRVTKDLADDLHDLKDRGDSYEDVIRRLIEEAEGDDA